MTYTRKPCARPLFLLMLLTALFALLALLLPGRALADGATSVWVMGGWLTNDTYYTIANDGTLQSDGNPNNYNVRFDPATSTLYLKNAKIAYTGNYAIFFDGDLTINLSGANEVSASNGESCDGIYGNYSNLTITGGGSLVVTTTCTVQAEWLYSAGIFLNNAGSAGLNLVIDTNTSVTCIAQAASGVMPSHAYGVDVNGAVTVRGTLNTSACAASSYSHGVLASGITLESTGTLTGQGATGAFTQLPTVNSPTALVWQGDTQAQAMATEGKAPTTAGDYHQSKYAAVGEGLLTAITLTSTAIAVNETYTITPTLTPANPANAVFRWSSSDTTIFTVNTQGTQAVLTGVGAGLAILTATTLDGSITATCQITVADSLPTVRVGNVDVTRGGRWQISETGEGSRVQIGSYNVAYDVGETTLSLNGLSLNSTFGTTAADNGAIYAADSINIRLSSTNEVRNSANFDTVSGLRINGGDLTVTGAGTLSVTAANRTATASTELYGVNVDGSLTVQTDATLTAAAAQVGSERHYLTRGVVADGNIEANGILEGSACAADAYSYGVFSGTGTIAVPGTLKGTAGTAGFSYGVVAGSAIAVTGELEGTANTATSESVGVVAGGAITTSGTLKGTSVSTSTVSYGVATLTSSITITAGTLEGQASSRAFFNRPDAASYTNAIAWFGDTQSQAMGKAGVVASNPTEQYQTHPYALVGPGVATLTMNLDDLTIAVNENGTLAIETIEPDDALNQVFEWQSDNPSVATVTPGSASRIAGRAITGPTSSATVTGVSEGTATITVSTREGNASATAVVTVNAAPAPATSTPPQTGDNEPLWLWVTLAGLSLLAIGTLYTLKQRKQGK